MKILTKYILREHVGPFIFGIATIMFIFLLNIVFRDLGRILGKGLPVVVVLQFFGLNLAWILALAIPMAVLIASLMAFGRLASDREIDAMKASAVPVHQLFRPILAAAAVLAVFMVQFNNSILPEFNHRLKMLYFDITRTKPAISLDPNVFYNEIPNYSILVQKIDQKKNLLKGVFINDTSDPRYNKTVVAESGNLIFLKQEEKIVFTLFNGEVHEVEKQNVQQYRRMKFQKQSISISVPGMALEHNTFQERGDREKTTRMLKADIREECNLLRERESNIIKLVRNDMQELFPGGYPSGNAYEQKPLFYHQNAQTRVQRMIDLIEGEAGVLGGYKRSINSLWVEVYKKYSIPFACLVFVLIGAPLGILVRQGGFATAGWLSFVFFLIYWAFLIGGEQLADRRILTPALAMWSPNLVVGCIGIFLYFRTLKETTLFPWSKITRIIKPWRQR
jgi:lipopolysaccharide export system permease protein